MPKYNALYARTFYMIYDKFKTHTTLQHNTHVCVVSTFLLVNILYPSLGNFSSVAFPFVTQCERTCVYVCVCVCVCVWGRLTIEVNVKQHLKGQSGVSVC